jgi:hypothetical protein
MLLILLKSQPLLLEEHLLIYGPPSAGLSSDTIPNPKVRPVGNSETYTLTVTNSVTGCSKTSSLTIYKSSPSILSTVTDTICGTDLVTLSATATSGAQIGWWSAPTGGTLLGTGPTFSSTIGTNTNFYAEAKDTIPQTPLTTNYTGGIIATDPNAAGNMFDITALNDIRVTGFNVHLNDNNTLAPSNISVYYKVGSYAGFVTNAGAWTLLGSYTGLVSAGAGVPTYLPLNFDLPVNAGQTYGIYIAVTNLGVSNSLRYSSNATSPAEFAVGASDFNLQVKSGTICFGPFTGQVAAPVSRLWNGSVLYSIGCSSARSTVAAVALPAPALNVTTTEDSVCLGSVTNVQVSSINDPNYSYVWTPGGFNGSSYPVSPTVNTTYTVTATDTSNGGNAGCITSSSINIVVNPVPAVPTITQDPLIVCGSSPVTLTASSSQPGVAQIGAGTSTNVTLGQTPFMGNYEGSRIQYLFTAAELNAQGINAGNLTSLAFNITTVTSTVPLTAYTVKLGTTAATSLTAYQTGLTTVYVAPTPHAPTAGWNTFNFNTPFVWNGTSNVVIEICHNNDPTGSCTGGSTVCWGGNSTVQSTTTAFTSIYGSYDDNTTPATNFDPCGGVFDGTPTGNGVTGTNRPNIRLGYGAATTFLWSTGATTAATVVTPPVGTTNYSVVATNNVGCTSTNSINVTTAAIAKPVITENDTTLCNPDFIYVHVQDTGVYSGGYPSGTTFTWSAIGVPLPDLDSISSSGNGSSYSVIVTLPNGCTSSSDTTTVLTKSVAVVDVINNATCSGGGSIEVEVTSGIANYNYVWSTDLAQTNIVRNVTLSSNRDTLANLTAGTYYLQVYDEAGTPASCNSGVLTYVVSGSNPIVASVTATNITCFGSSNGNADVTWTGGNAPFTITWSDANFANTTPRSISLAGNYSVIVSDLSGCADTVAFTIVEPAPVTVTFTSTPESFPGALDGTVTAIPAGGTAPYTVQWADEFFSPAGSGNPLTGLGAGLYYGLVTDTNACDNSVTVTADSIRVDVLSNATLNVKLIIEGYYDGVGGMQAALLNAGVGLSSTEVDTIVVELRDALSPSTMVHSATVVVNTNDSAMVTLPGSVIGNSYYIAVFHRNAVQTWSDLPVSFSGVTNYDFTTAATQAHGSNMIEVDPGVFAFYSGDVAPQDEVVDITDQGYVGNDIQNFASGYVPTDVSGDGVVDITDQAIIDNNITNFVGSIHPF